MSEASAPTSPLRLLRPICVLTILVALAGPLTQLTKSSPIHPWEAGLVTDAFRVTRGLPVYEDATTGHATHMYGPLSTYTLGAVFRLTGPGFLPARLISFLCALAAISLTVRACRRPGQRVVPIVTGCLLLGFGRVATDYVEPRPDLIALLLMLVALVCLYRGLARDHLGWHMAGLASLGLAFLFKQPAALACAIPITAFVLDRERRTTPLRVVMLLTPFAVVLALIGVFKLGFPHVFHYTIEVAAQYRIDPERAVGYVLWLLLSVPLVWLALGLWWREPGEPEAPADPILPWAVAAVLVATPAGALAAAKTGGLANSLLPAVFGFGALLLRLGDPLERRLTRWTGRPEWGARFGALVGVLLCVSILSVHADTEGGGSSYALGDVNYPHAVEVARSLPGVVVCPQDPTIPVRAKQYAGRNLVSEYDHAGWPEPLPPYFLDELKHAQWVITLGGEESPLNWPFLTGEKETSLKAAGFRRAEAPVLEGTVYTLWTR